MSESRKVEIVSLGTGEEVTVLMRHDGMVEVGVCIGEKEDDSLSALIEMSEAEKLASFIKRNMDVEESSND